MWASSFAPIQISLRAGHGPHGETKGVSPDCFQVRHLIWLVSVVCWFFFLILDQKSGINILVGTSAGTGARFSKVPKTLRVRKAICETANRLFCKGDLLTCFQGNKKKNDCEVWRLKSNPFLRYKRNCDTRKWPLKFRDFRETAPSPKSLTSFPGPPSSPRRQSPGKEVTWSRVDHFHKWRLPLHSLVFMLIRPTTLFLKRIFFWYLLFVARLEVLLALKQKNILFGRHYERGLLKWLRRRYLLPVTSAYDKIFWSSQIKKRNFRPCFTSLDRKHRGGVGGGGGGGGG